MKLPGSLSRYAMATALALGVLLPATAAQAKVAAADDRGFVIQQVLELSSPVDTVWGALLKPSGWWQSSHTWSGDAANLSIDPRAGGCFCEVLPNKASPRAAPRGSVEHMRVVYIEQPRVLRMAGGLGPLQSDAVTGTLTIQLKDAGEGKTQLMLEYVVGGYLRAPVQKMAPAVDGMLAGQMEGLAKSLGGAFSAAFPLPEEPAQQPDAPAATEVAPIPDAVEDAPAPSVAPIEPAAIPQIGIEQVDPDGIEPLAPTAPEGEVINR